MEIQAQILHQAVQAQCNAAENTRDDSRFIHTMALENAATQQAKFLTRQRTHAAIMDPSRSLTNNARFKISQFWLYLQILTFSCKTK